jgi:hypothetical protein
LPSQIASTPLVLRTSASSAPSSRKRDSAVASIGNDTDAAPH